MEKDLEDLLSQAFSSSEMSYMTSYSEEETDYKPLSSLEDDDAFEKLPALTEEDEEEEEPGSLSHNVKTDREQNWRNADITHNKGGEISTFSDDREVEGESGDEDIANNNPKQEEEEEEESDSGRCLSVHQWEDEWALSLVPNRKPLEEEGLGENIQNDSEDLPAFFDKPDEAAPEELNENAVADISSESEELEESEGKTDSSEEDQTEDLVGPQLSKEPLVMPHFEGDLNEFSEDWGGAGEGYAEYFPDLMGEEEDKGDTETEVNMGEDTCGVRNDEEMPDSSDESKEDVEESSEEDQGVCFDEERAIGEQEKQEVLDSCNSDDERALPLEDLGEERLEGQSNLDGVDSRDIEFISTDLTLGVPVEPFRIIVEEYEHPITTEDNREVSQVDVTEVDNYTNESIKQTEIIESSGEEPTLFLNIESSVIGSILDDEMQSATIKNQRDPCQFKEVEEEENQQHKLRDLAKDLNACDHTTDEEFKMVPGDIMRAVTQRSNPEASYQEGEAELEKVKSQESEVDENDQEKIRIFMANPSSIDNVPVRVAFSLHEHADADEELESRLNEAQNPKEIEYENCLTEDFTSKGSRMMLEPRYVGNLTFQPFTIMPPLEVSVENEPKERAYGLSLRGQDILEGNIVEDIQAGATDFNPMSLRSSDLDNLWKERKMDMVTPQVDMTSSEEEREIFLGSEQMTAYKLLKTEIYPDCKEEAQLFTTAQSFVSPWEGDREDTEEYQTVEVAQALKKEDLDEHRIEAFNRFYDSNSDDQDSTKLKESSNQFGKKHTVRFCLEKDPSLVHVAGNTDSSDSDSQSSSADVKETPHGHLVHRIKGEAERIRPSVEFEDDSDSEDFSERRAHLLHQSRAKEEELNGSSRDLKAQRRAQKSPSVLWTLLRISLVIALGVLIFWWTADQLDWASFEDLFNS
uniref:Myosin heavy chain, striated muscle-like n=1 Tax=Lepisosteus oculatus TaxID=7918 RepID=W5NEL9_LEPOC|nr:PREDICTED: myosin heavy chain, striated muscle-like [Lepisosteus oculatus]